MKELEVGDEWLHDVLAGDAELQGLMGGAVRVFADLAAPDAPLPVIVYSYQSGNDVMGANADRIMVDATYQVKVIGAGGSYAPIQPIANRIDKVLHLAEATVATGEVFACFRTAPIKYPTTENGQQYRHLGGTYTLLLQAE